MIDRFIGKSHTLTEQDLIFNESTAMWKGRQLRDMTRDELYHAFHEMGGYYEGEIKGYKSALNLL